MTLEPTRWRHIRRGLLAAVILAALSIAPLSAGAAGGNGNGVAAYSGLSASQRAVLLGIARDT